MRRSLEVTALLRISCSTRVSSGFASRRYVEREPPAAFFRITFLIYTAVQLRPFSHLHADAMADVIARGVLMANARRPGIFQIPAHSSLTIRLSFYFFSLCSLAVSLSFSLSHTHTHTLSLFLSSFLFLPFRSFVRSAVSFFLLPLFFTKIRTYFAGIAGGITFIGTSWRFVGWNEPRTGALRAATEAGTAIIAWHRGAFRFYAGQDLELARTSVRSAA